MNDFLWSYYGRPAEEMRQRQACYAGPAGGVGEWLGGFVEAGASHLVLRFAGDHERNLENFARLRNDLGW